MPNHVYCCAECGEMKINVVMPKAEGCKESPFHRWINIGVEGTKEFRCSNCHALVHTLKPPVSYGCREHTFHDWKEL